MLARHSSGLRCGRTIGRLRGNEKSPACSASSMSAGSRSCVARAASASTPLMRNISDGYSIPCAGSVFSYGAPAQAARSPSPEPSTNMPAADRAAPGLGLHQQRVHPVLVGHDDADGQRVEQQRHAGLDQHVVERRSCRPRCRRPGPGCGWRSSGAARSARPGRRSAPAVRRPVRAPPAGARRARWRAARRRWTARRRCPPHPCSRCARPGSWRARRGPRRPRPSRRPARRRRRRRRTRRAPASAGRAPPASCASRGLLGGAAGEGAVSTAPSGTGDTSRR